MRIGLIAYLSLGSLISCQVELHLKENVNNRVSCYLNVVWKRGSSTQLMYTHPVVIWGSLVACRSCDEAVHLAGHLTSVCEEVCASSLPVMWKYTLPYPMVMRRGWPVILVVMWIGSSPVNVYGCVDGSLTNPYHHHPCTQPVVMWKGLHLCCVWLWRCVFLCPMVLKTSACPPGVEVHLLGS